MAVNGNMDPVAPRRHDEELFERFVELVSLLESGAPGAAAFVERDPRFAADLRALAQQWREVDGLVRSLGSGHSLVRNALSQLEDDRAQEQAAAVIARLAATNDFAARYAPGEEIGRGGMGVVHRVRDRVLGRDLALKRMHLGPAVASGRLLRRFLEEAELSSRLEHPGIVPIHELGIDADGNVYFTMPLVRGRTFGEVMALSRAGHADAAGRWTRARALEVLLKVCDAVAYAHARGIVHRDLKPANVLVGQFGEVFVVDWGLARVLGAQETTGKSRVADAVATVDATDSLTLEGEILGTPAYMAPEQAEGRRAAIDARTDVYALGAMLYELLSGTRPYASTAHAATSRETLDAVRRGPPPPIEEIDPAAPRELTSIARRAMARDPDQRYQSARAFADDVRASLEGRVVGAHEGGAWAETKKWVRRNRALATALLGIVVALGVGLGVALVLLTRTRDEKANVLRLSAFQELDDLRAEAAELWPAQPVQIAAYRGWLVRARALVQRLHQDALGNDPGLRATRDALASRQSRWNEEDRWWHAQLVKLIRELEAFAHRGTGLIEGVSPAHGWGVVRRLELAESLERQAPSLALQWDRAVRSIADRAACPVYDGLVIEPQLDLVPIGRDPDSGLWEFAHAMTGAVPTRDDHGRLVPDAAMSVILVLLPPGRFWMGAQATDPKDRHYDADASNHEGPVHEVDVPAFFMSKYELTQNQWMRLAGSNKSVFPASLHPIQMIDRSDLIAILARAELVLPSEEQWEYAARAGTDTKFWTGDDPESLRGAANLCDESMGRTGKIDVNRFGLPGYDDGYAHASPIGLFRANPFGLHDILGNVMEWCVDASKGRYDADAGAGWDDPVQSARYFVFVHRGGGFVHGPSGCRASHRRTASESYANYDLGVRPARAVVRR